MLEIDGATLAESLVTVEYLAERAGGPFFLEDARRRASARLAVEVHPFGNMFAYLKVKDDAASLAARVAEFEASLEAFERFLAVHAPPDGPFLGGAAFSFADADVAPFVQRIVPALAHYCDVDVRALCAPHARVARLVDALLARDSVKKTGVPDATFIANTAKMMARFAAMK